MREVHVFKFANKDGKGQSNKVLDGIGCFIEYGVSYEEFKNGAGNFSTAIVEMHDGTVRNIAVEMIKFFNPLIGDT